MDRVLSRINTFIRGNEFVQTKLPLPTQSKWFLERSLQDIIWSSGAQIQLIHRKELVALIKGSQSEVESASHSIVKLMYDDFASHKIIAKTVYARKCCSNYVNARPRTTCDELLKAEWRHEIDDCTIIEGYSICFVTGFRPKVESRARMLTRSHERVALFEVNVDQSQVEEVIGGSGDNIIRLKEGLNVTVDFDGGTISGAPESIRVFLQRLRDAFPEFLLEEPKDCSIVSIVCPGCSQAFWSPSDLVEHATLNNDNCSACVCGGGCGAVWADRQSCQLHEAVCSSVHRHHASDKVVGSVLHVQQHIASGICGISHCGGYHTLFENKVAAPQRRRSCEHNKKYRPEKPTEFERHRKEERVRAEEGPRKLEQAWVPIDLGTTNQEELADFECHRKEERLRAEERPRKLEQAWVPIDLDATTWEMSNLFGQCRCNSQSVNARRTVDHETSYSL